MDFLDKCKSFIIYYKVNLILGIVLILIIILSNIGVYMSIVNKADKKDVEEKNTYVEKVPIEGEEKDFYKVDIKGAVNNPGVYELEEESRVIDVIKKSGGLTEEADTSVNNLSKKITDEMVIVIYTFDEVSKFSEVKEKEEIEDRECIVYNQEINNDSCINITDTTISSNDNYLEVDTKISLNTATIELLIALPGIGESKAKNIISYREQNGNFNNIEEIMNVSGIGESAFEKIKEYITV